jgi:hypothetical protein
MGIAAAAIGAGVAAAGSIAAAGISSSASSGAAKKQAQLADAQQKRLLQAAGQIPMENWDVNAQALASQSIGYGLAEAPEINQQNMVQLQRMLDQTMPGWREMMSQATSNASDLLRGAIPQDISDLTRRTAAQGAISGGFAGTGAAGSLTARDLGLTSLQLQQTGMSELQSLLQTTRSYLMPQPVDPMSLLPLNTLVNSSEFQKQGELSNALAKYTATANAFNVGYQGQLASVNTAAGGTSALTSGIGSVSGILSKLVASGQLNSMFGGGGTDPLAGLGTGAYSGSAGGNVGSVATSGAGSSDFNDLFGAGLALQY